MAIARKIRILLDPGHGPGRDYNRGALYYNEGDNNWKFAMALKKLLESAGFVVGLTRDENQDDPSLEDRGEMARGYDLMISLHSNGSKTHTARGTTILDDMNPAKAMTALCDLLGEAIAADFGHKWRGTKYKDYKTAEWLEAPDATKKNWYGLLRMNKGAHGFIVELGFHDQPEDCMFFKNSHGKLASTMTRVLASWYYGQATETAPEKLVFLPGDTGIGVEVLQGELNRLKAVAVPLDVDGHYGDLTKAAVLAFQTKHGLTKDGEAGPQTLRKIAELIAILDAPAPGPRVMYRVVAATFENPANADACIANLEKLGWEGAFKVEHIK